MSISDQDMENIALRAAKHLEGKIREQEERLWKMLTLAAVVVTTVGVILSSAAIRWFVSDAVTTSTGAMNSRLASEIGYQRLANLALSMEQNAQISPNDRDAAILLLREISRDEDVAGRIELLTFVEKVVDSFHAAGLGADLNQINEMFGDVLVSHRGIAFTMIEHYGQKVVGSGLPLADMDLEYEILRRYMTGVPPDPSLTGHIHAWKLLVEFMRAGATPATSNLASIAQQLSDDSKTVLGQQLWYFRDPSRWQLEPTQEGLEISRLYDRLIATYPDLEELEVIPPNRE